MPLTESTIESAIDSLKSSPGKFQRLVEYYAYLTYPDRFKDLVPQGRNPRDVAVKGWPDIYARSSDNRMDVAEATHSPEWHTHLEEDLQKAEALGEGHLSGFLFVAWANEPSPLTDHKVKNPRYEQLIGYRARLIALDIPPENINFVFKKQLVRALAQPRFAAVLTRLLDLKSSSLPFRTVSGSKQLFGTAGRYDVFAPAKEEYQEGLVHRAAVTDEVEQRLESLGWAWIRGRGAAGKTVLSVHVGLGYESRSLPAYYLDLSEADVSVSDALNVITTHADEGVLFIIDNVHLNQSFARDCFDHWQSAPGGSRLLMIGRDTTTVDVRGGGLPLDDLREQALTLVVGKYDLEGIFLRLMSRQLSTSSSIQRPPQDILERWLRLFGGDLIAFSAAVARRLIRSAQSDWDIKAEDAARYIQAAYLGNAGEAERLNLLRLAALAQLEFAVPEDALELTKLEPFLQKGLVHRVGHANRYGYYRLIHPGLGALLLTAAGFSSGELEQFVFEQWSYVACRKPLVGGQIAARLESLNKAEQAASILKGIIELENGLEEILLEDGLRNFRNNFERFTRLEVLSDSEIEQHIVSKTSKIYQVAMNTPLEQLPTFLTYAELKLPGAYAAFAVVLERPHVLATLSATALRTQFHYLTFFLEYAERKLPIVWHTLLAVLETPEAVDTLTASALRSAFEPLTLFLGYIERKLPRTYAAVTAVLSRPESIEALSASALSAPLNELTTFLGYAEQGVPGVYNSLMARLETAEAGEVLSATALRTQFHYLTFFLEYAERKLPNLYARLSVALESPPAIEALGAAVLNAPLGHLTAFLEYAGRRLPHLHVSIEAVLRQPATIETLATKALGTPLDQITYFLRYAEQKLPIINQSLTDKLTSPETISALAETACVTPLDQLLGFLQNVPFGPEVLLAIDLDTWNKFRLASRPEPPYCFPAIAKLFQRLGRPELAETPALLLIKAAERHHWHGGGVGLHHISHVLRVGRAAGPEAIINFLTRIVTPAWLKEQYTKATSYGLAGSLFGLWGYHDEDILAHFRGDFLKSRMRFELNNLDIKTPEYLSWVLQLLGASTLIGVSVSKINIRRPSADQINEAAQLTTPAADATAVTYITVQFWVGLRVLAKLRPDHMYYIEPELGDRVLTLWKNSAGNTDKQNALNESMVNWLEQCAQAGWMLINH